MAVDYLYALEEGEMYETRTFISALYRE